MAGETSSISKSSKTTAQIKFKSPICKDNADINQRRILVFGSPPAIGIPIIDVNRFAFIADTNVYKIREALCSWGCFQVLNHGIERSLLDGVRQFGRDFFQPATEKQNYALNAGGNGGYSTNVLVVDNQFPNNLGPRIVSEERQKPQSFKEVMVDYSAELKRVEEGILKLISKALRLSDEKILTRKTGVMYAQLNYYPPSPSPAQTVLSLREHADASVITLLLQDDQMGETQVLKDGTWYSISIKANALFVFVGDQLEIMSNGIFKSRVHRAVRLNTGAEGSSLAVFSLPEVGEEVGPIDELVADGRPRMFKKVNNYMGFYYPYFCKGRRALDALRL